MKSKIGAFDVRVDSRLLSLSVLKIAERGSPRQPLPLPPKNLNSSQALVPQTMGDGTRKNDTSKANGPAVTIVYEPPRVFYTSSSSATLFLQICHVMTALGLLGSAHALFRRVLCDTLSFMPLLWLVPATHHTFVLYQRKKDTSVQLLCGFVYMTSFPVWLFLSVSTSEEINSSYTMVSSVTMGSLIIFYCVISFWSIACTCIYVSFLSLVGPMSGIVEGGVVEALYHVTMALTLLYAARGPIVDG